MGIFQKIAAAVRDVVTSLDETMPPLPTPTPAKPAPKRPVRADMSAPTPMGGGGCPLRLLEMAGFGGVVVATLVAAIVGRTRR